MILGYKVHPLLSCSCSPDLICFLEHERAAGEILRTRTRHPGRGDTLIEDVPRPSETPPLAQRKATLDFVGANSLTRRNETDIEDFDDSANALWSLYGKEAKGCDEATIQSIKDDMDGVLIFVCIYFPLFWELNRVDQ
jgi:hypothetical protein